MASGDELLAIAEDQRLRDAFVLVRSMPPATRDLQPLLRLLGTDELRAGATSTFMEDWKTTYEINCRIEILRQQVKRVSPDSIVVRTCERDWVHIVDVTGENVTLRGGRGCVRAVVRVFERHGSDGWSNTATLQEHNHPCRDIESICSGFVTERRPPEPAT